MVFFLLPEKDQVTNKKEEMKTVLIPTLGISHLSFPLPYEQGEDAACACTGSSQTQSPFAKKSMHCVTSIFILFYTIFVFRCMPCRSSGNSGSVDQ